MQTKPITAIKGMNDILPEYAQSWLYLEDQLRKWLVSYGYSNLRTPIVEATDLFIRAIGDVTDIVEKEMYSFTDHLNGDSLTLRPEGTAGCLRAVIEHNLLYNNSQKLWYLGPMFRHERPQKGRYRQFHQLGVEALGFQGPDIDSEIILMQYDLWQRLGLTKLKLEINCLGNYATRVKYRHALIEYFSRYEELLDEHSKNRLHKNPLRLLDSKDEQLQQIIATAPKLTDYLNYDEQRHFAQWQENLNMLAIPFTLNPRLVRGLDYYNLSVFEWLSDDLGAQATVCAGGRYDPLITKLGGKENYAIGFAIGIERLLLILTELALLPESNSVDIFIANICTDMVDSKLTGLNDFTHANALQGCNGNNLNNSNCANLVKIFNIATIARQFGLTVVQNFSAISLKSQLKRAHNLNAKFCVIVGDNELQQQQIIIKSMQQMEQITLKLDQWEIWCRNLS